MEGKTPRKEEQSTGTLGPMLVKRATVVWVVALLLFAGLLLRVLLLQTVDYERYQQKVLQQVTTESQVTAARGSIYDVNGMVLATNISTYRVFISPSGIARAQAEHDQNGSNVRLDDLIASHLSELLNVSYDFVIRQTEYTGYLDRTIKREVSEEIADYVRGFIAEYGLGQMVYLESTSTRYYPHASLASHVLGFTGSDGTGLYGLEYQYDKMLCGTNGRYVTARDAQGNEMPYGYKEYIPAQNGYHVNTTLDVYVQSSLEEELKTAYLASNGQNRAAGIVMDVETGAILGMAVYPNFDLNDPWSMDEQSLQKLETSGFGIGTETYDKHKQELLMNMWSNKAITESYIPGSTFKVITAAMALEEAVVSPEDTNTCVGYSQVLGRRIHCHKVQGHGTLTFIEGIQQSCNPWLMRVGLGLGTKNFYSYLKAFGYLEKTGVDLPGEGGSLFASEKNFTELDLAIYAFGQNFNVTLIQQITAISAVANGGYLVTPHLVSSITDENGNVISSFNKGTRRQVVSEEVCAKVADILEGGVSGNGGAKNAYVAGYRIAAKTGTSEKKNAGSIGEYICSTVAFAPADDPKYAVIIMVDEPTSGLLYGSTVAAPYVGNVMETILPYLGVEAVYTDEELQKLAMKTPDLKYWSVGVARDYCKQRGIELEIVGDDDSIIYKQYPESGTVVEKAYAKIIAYTDKSIETETVKVPNVTGMSAVAANQALINAGLNVRILGTKNYLSGTGATVIQQSVPQGTEVPRGTVIEVTFRYLEDSD